MTRKRRGLNAADYRDKPKMIANFLNDALASGDTIVFVKAIGDVTRAQGMTKVSQETGLDRRTLPRGGWDWRVWSRSTGSVHIAAARASTGSGQIFIGINRAPLVRLCWSFVPDELSAFASKKPNG